MKQVNDLMSITTWDEVRNEVEKVNKPFCKLVDFANPDKSYEILKVRYPYGVLIFDKGRICLPDNNNTFHTIDSPDTPSKFRDALIYATYPLALQLSKSGEVYLESNDDIHPINIYKPGDFYGLYGIAAKSSGGHLNPVWSASSGARSAFVLPRIADIRSFNTLKKKYNISIKNPPKPFEHWSLFKDIAKNSGKSWSCEVLIFTKKWFEYLEPYVPQLLETESNLKWGPLFIQLMNESWAVSRIHRNLILYKIIRKSMAERLHIRRLPHNAYLLDTVDHLLGLSDESTIGFTPCNESELMLPSNIIEQAFIDSYKTTRNAPIIFVPSKLGHNNVSAVYHSFFHPTFIGTPSTTRETRNYIEELKNTKALLDDLKEAFKKNEEIYGTFFKDCNYDFFYVESAETNRIKLSSRIPEKDPILAGDMKKRWRNMDFPYRGPFTKACIRVSRPTKKRKHKE